MWNGKPRLECVDGRHPPSKTPVHTYCPGHAGVKGSDRAGRLAGKATLTSGLLLGRSEMLRSLRHTSCGHKASDITPSIAWRREAWKEEALDDLPERTRESHRQSDEQLNRFKGGVGETSERRGEAHMGFSERINIILN